MAKKEIHNAIVTRNTDDDLGVGLRGAIFFEAATLFDGEYPLPAYPCFPFASDKGAGFFFVPKVGDEVEIEIAVDDGGHDTSDVELPEPRWRCMIYSKNADIDAEFKKNYPWRMGWKTNSGHLLMFDDKEGEEMIQLSHKIGTILQINKEGSWLEKIIKNKIIDIANDYSIKVGGKEDRMITGNSTDIVGGKKIITVTGDCEITCAKAKVIASGDVEVTAGGNAKIMASEIHLNGSITEVTSKDSHMGVIDLITGFPIIPSNTVFMDA